MNKHQPKSRPGRTAVIVLAALVVLVIAGVLIVPRLIGRGGLDDWIARQIVGVAQTYIVPKVEFGKFEYDAPYTVHLTNLTLTAPDGTRVVEAGKVTVTLAETPSLSKPLVIQNIELDGATLRLVQTPEGGFKGLVPFVKGENISDQSKVGEESKMSNVFQIRKITLNNGGLYYDAGDGSPAMSVAGVNLDMGLQPDASAAGWYDLKFKTARPPQFDLAVDGRVNIDSLTLDLKEMALTSNIAAEQDNPLPPQIQKILRDHDARGTMNLKVSGTIPVREWKTSTITANVGIKPLNVARGDFKLPIDQAQLEASMSGGVVSVKTAQVDMCDGRLTLTDTQVDLNKEQMPGRLTWNLEGFELRELLRAQVAEGQTPRIAGKTLSSGSANFTVASLPESLDGSGSLKISEGRLVALPVISELMQVMDVLGKATGAYKLEDKMDVSFKLTSDGVRTEGGTLETMVAAARFNGLIGYDQRLNLEANAGPLEKVQGMLGEVGNIIGKVTDQLVKYKIEGTTSAPKVSVKPLGL